MLRHEKYVSKTKWDKVKDNIKGILSAIAIALLIRIFLIEPYKIPTQSMEPTILPSDMIMANKFWYGVRVPVIDWKIPGFSSPEVGDIVLFQTPTYTSPGWFIELSNFVTFGLFGLDNNAGNPKYFIKRTVAASGDVLRIVDPRVNNFAFHIEVNGKKMKLKAAPGQFTSNDTRFPGSGNFDFYVEKLGETTHYVQYEKQHYSSSQLRLPQDLQGYIYIPKDGDTLTFIMEESHDNVEALKASKKNSDFVSMHQMDRVRIDIVNGKEKKSIRTTGKIIEKIYKTNYKNTILSNDDVFNLITKGKVVIKIDEDFFFVMGDNRENSWDSRIWGMVNESFLLGSPLFRHFPFSRFGSLDKDL